MVHNPNHSKGGHVSRGPSYNILTSKGEFWNPEKANRRIKREAPLHVIKASAQKEGKKK